MIHEPALVNSRTTQVQTFSTILRAEIARLIGVGGARPWLIVATAFALATTILTFVLASIPAVQDAISFSFADLVSSGPMLILLVLALGVTTHTAREISDGTVLTSKTLSPRTRILFTARLTAWAAVTAALGLLVCLVSLLLGLVPSGMHSSTFGAVISSGVVAVFLSVLVVTFFVAGATLLQRGSIIVFAGMLLLVVLPVAFAVAGTLLSGSIGSALVMTSRALPGSLLLTGLQPPMSAPEASWSGWLSAVAGIMVWVTVSALLAFRRFRKPGYGDQ